MIVAILLAYLDRIGQRRHFRDVFAGRRDGARAHRRRRGRGVPRDRPLRRIDGPDDLRDGHLRRRGGRPHVHDLLDAAPRALDVLRARAAQRRGPQRRRARRARGARLPGGRPRGARDDGLHARDRLRELVSRRPRRATRGGSSLGALARARRGARASPAWIYRLGHRLNVGRFFRVLGIVLMVFAAGLLADAVENIQALGWLPSGHVLWDSSRIVSRVLERRRRLPLAPRLRRPPERSCRPPSWVTYLAISLVGVRPPRPRSGRRPKGVAAPAPSTGLAAAGPTTSAQSVILGKRGVAASAASALRKRTRGGRGPSRSGARTWSNAWSPS